MKRLFRMVYWLLPFVAACGGGSVTSPAGVPQQPLAASQSSRSGARGDAEIVGVRLPLAPSGSSDHLYVGNTGNNSITVYQHDASGNAAPLYTIAGSKTGINSPGQLSEDAAGNLYVANGSATKVSASPSILVFAHGARGNVAPIRKLAGPLTLIHNVSAMTVDQITGKIFVADFLPMTDFANVSTLRFAPNANGNVAPFAHTASDANGAFMLLATELASDSTGQNAIETTLPNQQADNGNGFTVSTFVKQFANNANLDYVYAIDAFGSSGVADDPTTKTYLVTNGLGIYRFAENTVGRGPNSPGGPPAQQYTPSLVSLITSDTCGSTLAVAPGPTPYTYVMHSVLNGCPKNGVYVYANNAAGNATPVRILSGAATLMNKPYGIYEGL